MHHCPLKHIKRGERVATRRADLSAADDTCSMEMFHNPRCAWRRIYECYDCSAKQAP